LRCEKEKIKTLPYFPRFLRFANDSSLSIVQSDIVPQISNEQQLVYIPVASTSQALLPFAYTSQALLDLPIASTSGQANAPQRTRSSSSTSRSSSCSSTSSGSSSSFGSSASSTNSNNLRYLLDPIPVMCTAESDCFCSDCDETYQSEFSFPSSLSINSSSELSVSDSD